MLKEDVACTVQEDHERFSELASGNARLPLANDGAWGLDVPGPSKVRPTAHPSTQCQKTVPEENSALDEVSKAVEDVVTSLKANVSVMAALVVRDILTKIPP